MDDHEYKNSSNDWRSKYLSAVVVPIQIFNRYIDDKKMGDIMWLAFCV